ncbi:MAG TPA: ABC-F family ATP-binding cassette domain-containing protein [Vicinamibacterales bacterium]|nr:ABC-F family ATP-binding cassette domain-containing protein [Vicinamibacterales bacterium]
MLQLQDVTKAFGEKVLLEHVTWQVGDRDRVGLCGPNGAGKTTLLKMLAGFDEPDSGVIQKPNALTLGYLPQDGLSHSGRTVVAEASLALKPLLDMKAEMHALEEQLGDASLNQADHEAILARYSEVQDRFRLSDGYQIELKVATVLRGLGFEPGMQEQLTDHLSGGWQMRLALAKLLLSAPDLLLLDEPTNHLDLDARNWLEEYLVAYPHSVILVSHDRYFLDAVVTHIADLTLRKITEYHTNYTKYLEQRDAALSRLREAKKRQDEEIQRVEEFINRFRYQATKAAQVQSRIKMLEKVERLEVPPERKRIHFQFPAAPKSGRMVLELKGAHKAYGDKTVLDSVDLHIERGDRIALVGHNGAGKSTLMRLLSGEEPPDRGTRTEGHQLVMQYFAQDEATRLDPSLTVYETLSAGSPHTMVPMIRNILGGFLFSGDDVYKKAGVLSGGERTRLAVARMLLRPSNTLLLDEPTNHLDIDSKEVLLDALVDYGGTLIFVSHDRYFVEKLATKIIEVGEGKATLYPGTYEAFLWSKGAQGVQDASAKSQAPSPKSQAPSPQAPAAREQTYEERKRATAEQRKRERAFKALKDRVAEMEARIAEREKAIKDVEQEMSAPEFYNTHEKSKPVLARHQELMWEVGELLAQWEMLQGELAAYDDLRNS